MNAAGSDTTVKMGYVTVTEQMNFKVYAEGSGLYPPGYSPVPDANRTPADLYNNLQTCGNIDPRKCWSGGGLYLDGDSNERHWNFREDANSYSDNADFSFFAGHGGNNKIIFGNQYMDTDLTSDSMKFGGNRLKWVTLSACNALDQSTWENWKPVFDGVHIVNGFDTEGFLTPDQGAIYADLLTGSGAYDLYSIRDAWKWTLKFTLNEESVRGAYMWADYCGNDYLPGFGNYCSEPMKNSLGQYQIWWDNFDCSNL